MEKTVNQWLDLIDQLEPQKKEDAKIRIFKDLLRQIKLDKQYKGYSGLLKIELPEDLEIYFEDSQLK